MFDAPIHIPHPLPTHPPIQRVTPTYDQLGHYVSAQVLCSDGSSWTINFPPYPTISPIIFTQAGKPPFTVSFVVDVDSFTFSANYDNEVTTVKAQSTGFPKWDVTTDEQTESMSTFPDLIRAVYTPFSNKFTWGLIGNISLLRDACATARALMMPANIDTTDQGDSYLTAAVAMSLIPPGLQIGVENLASIAWLAADAITSEPSYPLATAIDFFFGTASGVYETLIDAINPYLHGEGAGKRPKIPKTITTMPSPFKDDRNNPK